MITSRPHGDLIVSRVTPSEAISKTQITWRWPQENVMAGNPRKFSEKIALIKAKEAEANAEFDRILNEVSGITKTPDPVSIDHHFDRERLRDRDC